PGNRYRYRSTGSRRRPHRSGRRRRIYRTKQPTPRPFGRECPQAGTDDQTRPRNRLQLFSGGTAVSAAAKSLQRQATEAASAEQQSPSSTDTCRSKSISAGVENAMTVDVEDY